MGKAKLTIEKRTQNGGLKEGRLFSLSALKWALSTMPPSFPEQGWNLRPLQWKHSLKSWNARKSPNHQFQPYCKESYEMACVQYK